MLLEQSELIEKRKNYKENSKRMLQDNESKRKRKINRMDTIGHINKVKKETI